MGLDGPVRLKEVIHAWVTQRTAQAERESERSREALFSD